MNYLSTRPLVAAEIPDLFPELADKPTPLAWCKYNEAAGPAFVGELNGKVVGMGGLRTAGLAEAWMYWSPEVAGSRLRDRITILRDVLEHLEYLEKKWSIWKVFGEADKGVDANTASQLEREDFLRFAGFKKNDKVYTKINQEFDDVRS